jgi:hypothetical protein
MIKSIIDYITHIASSHACTEIHIVAETGCAGARGEPAVLVTPCVGGAYDL